MCISCISGFFFNFIDYKNINCEKCQDNCTYCHFGNSTTEITTSDISDISFEEFTIISSNNSWDVICDSCLNEYALDANFNCKLCTSLIPNCSECINDDNNIVNCLQCTDNNFLNKETNLCYACNINNCIDCYIKENKNFICNNCEKGFYLLNNTCYSCPKNCDICENKLSTILCQQCDNNSYLFYENNTCLPLNDDQQITFCSSYLSIENMFLCQTCNDTQYIPTLFNGCSPCWLLDGNLFGCESCFQIVNNTLNVTYLIEQNHEILYSLINNLISLQATYFCTSCIPTYALNPYFGTCCPPSTIQFPSVANTIISGCVSCKTCHPLIPYCIECNNCSQIFSNNLNFDDKMINLVDYKNPLYFKRLYYILLNEAMFFAIEPTIQDKDLIYINKIYMSLNQQYQIDIAAKYLYLCSPCQITSTKQCTLNSNYNFLNQNKYFVSNYIELSYQTNSANECLPGFSWHNKYFKCFYCPHNWKNCSAYKKLNLRLSNNNCSISESFCLNNITELFSFLQELENNEFSIIMNEFAVQDIEININFDLNTTHLLIYKDTQISFTSVLLIRIPFLENYTLNFMPNGYMEDKNAFSTCQLLTSMFFSGFTKINFYNINFQLIPVYFYTKIPVGTDIFTLVPGLISQNIDKFVLINCSFLQMKEISSCLVNGELYIIKESNETCFSNLNNTTLFILEIHAYSGILISNVTLSGNFSNELLYDHLNLQRMIYLGLRDSGIILISNLFINDSVIRRNLLTIEQNLLTLNSIVYFLNFTCYNVDWKSSFIDSFISIVSSQTQFINFIILNYSFTLGNCLFELYQGGLFLRDFSMKNCDINVESLFLSLFFEIINLFILNCSFLNSYLLESYNFFSIDQNKTKLYFYNIILATNFFVFQIDKNLIHLVSDNKNNYISEFINMSILNCQREILEKKNSNVFFRIILLFEMSQVIITNFVLSNSSKFCGLFIYDSDYIIISNIVIENNEIEDICDHNSIYINPVSNPIILINIFMNNIYSFYGIIVIESIDDIPLIGIINISKLKIYNSIIFTYNLEDSSSLIIWSMQQIITYISESVFSYLINFDATLKQKSASSINYESWLSNITILSTNFSLSSSYNKSSQIFVQAKSLELNNCIFSDINYYDSNTPTNNMTITYGGVGHIIIRNLIIENSIFDKCFGFTGGIFYLSLYGVSYIQVHNCSFSNIFSLYKGGIFYYVTLDVSEIFFNVSHSNFSTVGSIDEGGVFFIKSQGNNTLNFEDCIFFNLNSLKSGLIFAENIILNFIKCVIYENNMSLKDNKSIFKNDNFTSYNDGGSSSSLFYIRNGNLTFKDTKIYNISPPINSNIPFFAIMSSYFYFAKSNITSSKFLNSFFVFMSVFNVLIEDSYFFNCSSYLNENEMKNPNISAFILGKEGSNLIIKNSIVDSILCLNCLNGGGFFALIDSSSLFIDNTVFKNNQAYSGSCLYAIGNNDYFELINNQIINSIFENNLAIENGGAIFIYENNFFLKNISFIKCMSSMNGGSIYFYAENLNNNLEISYSIFQENFANIGAAVYYQGKQIIINQTNNIFKNNKAEYFGNNLYSYPQKLKICEINNLTNLSIEDQYKLYDFRSGDILPNISIRIFDEEDNILPYILLHFVPSLNLQVDFEPDDLKMLITLNDGREIIENFENSSLFKLTNIKLIGQPNSTVRIKITSPSIRNFTTINYSLELIIHLRSCVIGELQDSSGTCIPCNGGYSFNVSDRFCKQCLDGLICNSFGETFVKPGYWRESIYSENIVLCENSETLCVGGSSAGDKLCSIGHIGALCESCDLMNVFWENSYTQSSIFDCKRCDSFNLNHIYFIILTILIFIWISLSVKSAMRNIKTTLIRKLIKSLSRFSLMPERKDETYIYLKIYLGYFQIINSLWGMNLLFIPDEFKFFSITLANPLIIVSNSAQCLIPLIQLHIPPVYSKLLIMILSPFFYVGIFIIGFCLYVRKKNIRKKYSMLYTVVLFSVIFFQPSVIKATIDSLTCIKISNNFFLKADLSFNCNNNDYWYYSFALALPVLLFWSLMIPGYFFFRMFVHREKLHEIDYIRKYGYLCQEYKLFFWEFIRMYEKILILIFLEFYDTQIIFKYLLILMVIALYFVLTTKFRPYKLKIQNRLEKITTIICFSSILFGLLTIAYPVSYVIYGCYFLIFLINILFNLSFLKLIFESFFFYIDFESDNGSKYSKSFIRFIKKYVYKIKKYKTVELWLRVRRMLARYLRERDRRNAQNSANVDFQFFKLSLPNYDPQSVGVHNTRRKAQLLKQIKVPGRLSLNISEDLKTPKCPNSPSTSKSIISPKSQRSDIQKGLKNVSLNKSENHLISITEFSSFEYKKNENVLLEEFMNSTLKKLRISDFESKD